MSDFKLLAQASGCRVYQKEDLIILKELPSQWISTARFVLLLMSGIPLVFGVISLLTHFQGYNTRLGMSIIFIVVGSVFGFVYVFLNKYAKKVKAIPPAEFHTICAIDVENRSLLDSKGKKLDSLENVSVERQYQMTSSSKKLVLKYGGGTLLIAKGNPFAGGTSPLESIFHQFGLMK